MNKLTINKNNLKKVMEKVFNKIAVNASDNIEIASDYYLNIPMGEAYDVGMDVKPSVGSLFDDCENLVNVANNQQPSTFVDLDRLASILKAISQELNPPSQ